MAKRFVAAVIPTSGKSNMWEVPEDFSHDEMRLLAEICANGTLSYPEAQACVRHLRK